MWFRKRAKRLSLRDMCRVYDILRPHYDARLSLHKFISRALRNISVDDFLCIMKLGAGLDEQQVRGMSPLEQLKTFAAILLENDFEDFVAFVERIGSGRRAT